MDTGLSSLSAVTPSASSDAWDALKKAARRVESQAYTRLTDYSRIAQTVSASTAQALNAHSSLLSSPAGSLLSSAAASSSPPIAEVIASSTAKAAELETEITDLLQKLSTTTEEMSRVIASDSAAAAASASSSGVSGGSLAVGSETNGYTLQRYRAILHDYSNEFRKTRDNLNAARQRAELLLPAAASPAAAAAAALSSSSSPNSLRPRNDLLLREKSSLHSSLRMADDLISQAAEARESLLGQSSMFQAMRGRVAGIRQRFPLLHSVMSRIERQRKKDAIVIAAVIATCICFTIVYISNKPID